MKFLVDNSLSWRLAEWLRNSGHDAVHVSEIGMRDSDDIEIYRRAEAESRIIIAQDVDFGWLMVNDDDCKNSVILYRISESRVSRQIDRLSDLLTRLKKELVPGRMIVITDAAFRIRQF